MTIQHGVAETKFEARSSKFEIHPPKAGKNSNDQNPSVLNKCGTKTLMQVVVVLLALAVCFSACAGKSASSKFYVLSPLPLTKLSGGEGAVIGVLPIHLPDYLDRPQVVTRVSENELKLDEFNRWAEPLRDNFYRVLVENLSTLLTSVKVIETAQRAKVPVTLDVGVDVSLFDGTLGGDVVLTVKWGLITSEGGKLLLAKRSSFKEPTGAATYEALVAAHSRAVAALSREIAEAIRTVK